MTTKPRTVRERDSVLLADWLCNLDGIHHVVVLDATDRVVGIVSDRDILRAFGRKPSGEVPIREIMTRDVQTVGLDVHARDALETMIGAGFHALPVVDGERRLMGIVTASDFLEVARWALSQVDSRHVRASASSSTDA